MPMLLMTATPREMPRSLTVLADPDAPPVVPGGAELTTRSVVRPRRQGLFGCGQREGVFRADLPVSWLLAVTHLAMNAAAEEVTAGRIEHAEAAGLIVGTLLPAFTVSEGR
ncbi:hypothetical protein V1260_09125 [Brachybacterium sp. J144]|uniref:hypothetical protein n=1 Tax=Brachybacterium sp. J144 TaxID=3116487 RepID=UPI002E779720|nr:hypothetical protein [Brachybacterium sp. J144]MEE1650953.1 hypothetical protein [Brachybacterium sp. J144]